MPVLEEEKSQQAVDGRRRPMPDSHKMALAQGRFESRVVGRYLEALAAHRPRRGRKRTIESVERRLEIVERLLATTTISSVERLNLVTEREDLRSELETMQHNSTVDMEALETEFVQVALQYSNRKGISYSAWRTVGVEPEVLKKAGITRTSGALAS